VFEAKRFGISLQTPKRFFLFAVAFFEQAEF
jgi:hypothetical protein